MSEYNDYKVLIWWCWWVEVVGQARNRNNNKFLKIFYVFGLDHFYDEWKMTPDLTPPGMEISTLMTFLTFFHIGWWSRVDPSVEFSTFFIFFLLW